METKNLFIDTSTFRNKAFDLNNSTLKKLKELGQNGDILLVTTSITAKECEKHLLEVINECESKTSKLNVHLLAIGKDKIDFEEIRTLSLKAWKGYVTESKVVEIPIYNGSVEEIFDNYFKALPPFGVGNKKNEFPDAFVLETLKKWCKDNNQKIYAVSSDKPFSEYGETDIIPLKSIEEFLDIYNKFESEKKKEEINLYSFALESYSYHQKSIETEITEQLERRYYDIPDLWDCEVEEINITDIKFLKPYFIETNKDYCQIEVDVITRLSLTINFENPNMIYRDSETDNLVSLETIDEKVSGRVSIPVLIDIRFLNPSNPIDSQLQLVRLPKEFETDVFIDFEHEHYRMSSKEYI